MKKNEVIIVGWIRKGRPADCGETMKNQLLIQKLEQLGVHCRQMDFKDWRKHPWTFLQLAWNIFSKKNATLILSSSCMNIYPIMKLLKLLHWKMNCIHWVIGGNLGNAIAQGKYCVKYLNYATHTLVESRLMVEQMQKSGMRNVIQVPNFKPISYYPSISGKAARIKDNSVPLRFVFLSRILPEKGCSYIIEAAKKLSDSQMQQTFSVDFYGSIAPNYEKDFRKKLQECDNVHYCGFLNLRENKGYDMLASYDVMLFPTYWNGEGFAGVFMDAFISGLPIILTEWAHNSQFIREGETGLFIPVHDADALAAKMKECIYGKHNIADMSHNCQKEAAKYNVDNVITKEILSELNII